MHYNLTGYNYVLNNPISFMDPWGLDTVNANNLKDEWGNFNPDKDVVEMDPVDIPPPNNNGSGGYSEWADYDLWDPFGGSEGRMSVPFYIPAPIIASSSTGPFKELSNPLQNGVTSITLRKSKNIVNLETIAPLPLLQDKLTVSAFT